MIRRSTDLELILWANRALHATSTAHLKVRVGPLVWSEAVRRVAAHLAFMRDHGVPIPRVIDVGLAGQQATAELLESVREEVARAVVAEAERSSLGDERAA